LGETELARWLQQLDPQAAAAIDPRNVRRVIRALEVTLVTGRPITELQRKTPPPYEIAIIGLMRGRESLYARIDTRVEQMMANGLFGEVEALRAAGYDWRLPSLSGLGYRQLYSYLEGEMTLEEAVERIKFETHRFARQQGTWFGRDDPRITWFDLDHLENPATTIISFVSDWLSRKRINQ
jgi:tRNA dimethylallyltransferase